MYEKSILIYLVEHYRNSKKDSGSNKTKRRTGLKPETLYEKYNANDGDIEKISKLNETVKSLEEKKFVLGDKETFGTQLQCIYLEDEKIQEIEQYLTKEYGYRSKDMKLGQLQDLVDKYQDASPICGRACSVLTDCINNRKIPKDMDALDKILQAVAFIDKNQEDLYIREVSMKVYGDSKYFEEKTLQPVCKMLWKYSKRKADNELVDEILRDYHITKEPQKICIKGNAIIYISGKTVDISGFTEGIEFMVSDLKNIQSVKIQAAEFMTIENRTSYLRYNGDDIVTFFLGGYINRYQRDFIKLVYASNPEVRYKHFGDIDAGGFWIHDNLCEVTGVKFELFSMSAEELKNEEYVNCIQELSENDRSRLQKLKEMDMYAEVIDYMLAQNAKLEQEIVSLTLMKKS